MTDNDTDSTEQICGHANCDEPTFKHMDFCCLRHETETVGRSAVVDRSHNPK